MWNASRCAVRLPMPGSLPSSVIRRWIGGAYNAGRPASCETATRAHAGRQAEAAEVQAAGQAAHLLGGMLLRLRGSPR